MTDFPLDRRTALKIAGTTMLAGGFTLGTAGTAAADEHATPFEVEGPIEGVDTVNNTITAMGMTIHTSTATLTSPSGVNLTLADLEGGLPARPEGFIGGTLKGAGIITQLDPLVLTLENAICEPAENVVAGAVTANDVPYPAGGEGATTIAINGVTMAPIDDWRMPHPGWYDAAGSKLEPGDIETRAFAAAEGYFGSDGNLHIFASEFDFVVGGAGGDGGEQTESISIHRAEFRPDKEELRARGAASDEDLTVRIYDVTDGAKDEVVRDIVVDEIDNAWGFDVEDTGLVPNPDLWIMAELGEEVESDTGAMVWERSGWTDPFQVTID